MFTWGIFEATTTSTDDPTKYVTRFKATMSQLKPPPVRQQLQHKSHVSNALSHCTHVFVRYDKVRKPLQPPYVTRFARRGLIRAPLQYTDFATTR